MALGAERANVYRLILIEASQLIVVGVTLGIGASIGAAVLMRKLLFGVQAWDVSTLFAVAFVLASSALLASYIPARRAASVSPAESLRSE
jgi:macrolide transport system ATP-binding/permease protein